MNMELVIKHTLRITSNVKYRQHQEDNTLFEYLKRSKIVAVGQNLFQILILNSDFNHQEQETLVDQMTIT